MSGAILLLPQYAVMALTGVTLPLNVCHLCHLFIYGCQGLRFHLKQTAAVPYC